jgi:hypothetical protein
MNCGGRCRHGFNESEKFSLKAIGEVATLMA